MGIETIIGGAIGLIGSSQSADAVSDAAAATAEVNKYIFDTTVALQQPFLNTGYAANNELAALYGLAPPIPATPAPTAQASGYYYPPTTQPTAQPTNVPPGYVPASGDVYQTTGATQGYMPAPEGFIQQTDHAGNPSTIWVNPTTGQAYDSAIDYVDLQQNPKDYFDAMWAGYGVEAGSAPFEGESSSSYDAFVETQQPFIDFQMEQQGIAAGGTPGGAPPATGGSGTPGMSSAEQQQAAIERFYQSPEYQLMYQPAVQYGTEHLNQIAAAGGSFQSGAQAQALAGYAGDLASQTYGNYVNQLNSMAGYGQTAAGNIQTAGANYATGMGNAYMNAGNAQATGIAGMTNAALGGINAYMNYGGGYGGTNMVNTSMPYSTVPTGPGYAAGNGTIYLGSW